MLESMDLEAIAASLRVEIAEADNFGLSPKNSLND